MWIHSFVRSRLPPWRLTAEDATLSPNMLADAGGRSHFHAANQLEKVPEPGRARHRLPACDVVVNPPASRRGLPPAAEFLDQPPPRLWRKIQRSTRCSTTFLSRQRNSREAVRRGLCRRFNHNVRLMHWPGASLDRLAAYPSWCCCSFTGFRLLSMPCRTTGIRSSHLLLLVKPPHAVAALGGC